MASGS
ncbi:Cobalt-precorrin-2 C20-methyltransferase [Caballeronia sordidicola]